MSDGRAYLRRVWQLAEELAVRSGKPLHAFLLLHHVLTCPPPQLRSCTGTGGSSTSHSTSSIAAAGAAATPLHLPSLDAEWKCEELATRVRAAEYLLFPDATSMSSLRDASSAKAMASSSATATSAANISPSFPVAAGLGAATSEANSPASLTTTRTLSRVAALESLELAEQVLAPVFAASSHTRNKASLDTMLNEVTQKSFSTNDGNSPVQQSRSGVVYTGANGTDTCGASMYFLNESTVTALAWPLTSFTLTWPFDASTNENEPTAGVNRAIAGAVSPSSLHFKAANQTIMIAVALVVRAHVLQAVVCHRRAQYKRALQCLAEARKWVDRQFSEVAQTRSLRLIRADLQERRRLTGTVPSGSQPPSVDDLTLHLPHFQVVLRRLMKLEHRACEAMISTEECKVHFMILQSCGSLPPPPLQRASSENSAGGCGVSAQSAVHAQDLRLHYKRYQESVQQLHQASSLYMRVLEWLEEEEKEGEATENDGRRYARVKLEHCSGTTEGNERNERVDLSRDYVMIVQSQLSAFCLCTLHRSTTTSWSKESHAGVTELKQEMKAAQNAGSLTNSSHRADHSCSSSFVANYDLRLAAEVLGWYHCISFFYLLYQRTSSSAAATTNNNSGTAVGSAGRDRREREEAPEAEFFARYSGVSASVCPNAYAKSPFPTTLGASTASLLPSSAVPRDPVQRALAHFRIYAYIFGAFPPSQQRNKSESSGVVPGWHSDSETQQSSELPPPPLFPPPLSFHSTPSLVHEAGLLLCLAEVALTGNYSLALHFGNDAKERATRATLRTKLEKETNTKSPTTSAAVKQEVGTSEEADYAAKQQKYQSPMSAARKRGLSAFCVPPPSWHWVLPGVLTTLQLYLELSTVLMQASTTMQTSAPPPSPSRTVAAPPTTLATSPIAVRTGHTAETTPPPTFFAVSQAPVPPVPILQPGLQRAEQVLAQLLFTIDREMLQLTGNAWSMTAQSLVPSTPASAAGHAQPNDVRLSLTEYSHLPSLPSLSVNYLQPSLPAQLRWLVQIKAAALLTMARHHLTQLSIVRAVHYLREAQQFSRVFHRQVRLSLLPEMHVLLASVATYASLRRLPDIREHHEQRQIRNGTAAFNEGDDEGEADVGACGPGSNHDGTDILGPFNTNSRGAASLQEALYHFAQGWPAVGAASLTTSTAVSAVTSTPTFRAQLATNLEGNSPLSPAAFSILPSEEATIAQDVGLPYLHLLAAERAACASLHTPPSFILLLHLMKAWAVYQLVVAGEELSWRAETEFSEIDQCTGKCQQQQYEQVNAPLVTPLSPTCPPLPLPTASYGTTMVNSTLEDQQRRVARLDSLTSTPTGTPQLRNRHAALPAEMQRIQLDQPSLMSPAISPVKSPYPTTTTAVAVKSKIEEKAQDAQLQTLATESTGDNQISSDTAREPNVAVTAFPVSVTPTLTSAQPSGLSTSHKAHFAVYAQVSSSPLPAPAQLTSPSAGALSSSLEQQQQQQHTPKPTAHVTPIPLTTRHRAGDVLQRMLAVLRHHYDAYTQYTTSPDKPSTSAAASFDSVPRTAWTSQNVTLFRLLRGAVLLTEDRDEPAAARELKETTHYAKLHLGVLHPYVADGLSLLTNAYASLDVETVRSDRGVSSNSSTGSASSASSSQEGVSRTRRVAFQLAMRCSCTALASLAVSDPSIFSPFTKPVAPSTPWNGAEGTSATPDNADSTTSASNNINSNGGGASGHSPSQEQQQQFTVMHSRLRSWWSTQVLDDLCGNGSAHRSAHAVKQLQTLFDWLPETAGG